MHSIWWGRFEAKLREKRNETAQQLADGGALARGSEPGAVALSYMEQVGYLRGLAAAMQCADEVDIIMLGGSVGAGATDQDH